MTNAPAQPVQGVEAVADDEIMMAIVRGVASQATIEIDTDLPKVIRALFYASPAPAPEAPAGKFKRGDRVSKIKGSAWTGRVVGTYSTALTPEGYAVESETETGSVQIYPAAALALATQADDTKGGA